MGTPFGRRPDPGTSSLEAGTDDSVVRVQDRAARVRRIAAVLSAAGAIFAIALVLAGPVATSVARARGRALGLNVDVRRSSVGFGYFRFRDVSISSPDLPGVVATLARIDVYPGFGVRRPHIDVHGGRIRIRGSEEEIEHELSAFQGRKESPRSPGSERPTSILAEGIDVAWSGAVDRRRTDYAWGVRYERGADGRESIGVDLLRAAMANVDLEVHHGVAVFRRDRGARILASVSTEQISGTLRLDAERERGPPDAHDEHDIEEPVAPRAHPWRGRERPEESRKPKADLASSTGAEKSALASKFAERIGSKVDEHPGERRRAEIDRLVSTIAAVLVPPSKIELSGARFTLLDGENELNIGPASILVDREPDRMTVAFVPAALDAGTPVRFQAAVPIPHGPVDVDLVGGPVSLASLGVKEGDMGLRGVERAEIEVAGHARWSEDGRSVTVSGRSHVSDLGLYHPKLAPDAVRGLALGVDGDGSFTLDGSRIDLGKIEVVVGKVKVETRGTLERGDGFARGSLHVEVPLAACSDVLASTPAALVPLLQGLEMTGTLAFSGDLEFDTRRPGDTRITWDAANECRVTRVPESLSPDRFRRPWVRTVLGADGLPVSLETGPGTDTWVPLTDISPFMQTAIVVCEDSRFFQHDGFDSKAIQDSIRNNLRAGGFVRGASTVSMQLAKNLYLGREKTLSRKLQEAVLTLLLEQELSKEQILELYLNVIEFAPGVYGIGPAASYYFRSLPKDISLGQAIYLASILPNPKNRHFMPDGALSDAWSEYLRKLMVISHKIRRIDDHDLAVGLAETVRFGVPSELEAPRDAESPDVAPPEDGYPDEGP